MTVVPLGAQQPGTVAPIPLYDEKRGGEEAAGRSHASTIGFVGGSEEEFMNCARGELHIWRIGLDCTAAALAALQATLSPEEHARAKRFRTPNLQDRWSVSRGALRCILGSYLKIGPKALQFRVGTHGKPELEWPPEKLSFNLSHTRDLALLAVAGSGRVGVDAEDVQDGLDVEEIIRSNFAAAERDEILALPPDQRIRAFFATWVRKEAFIKALGGGLSLPLNQFVVSVRPEEPGRLISSAWDDPGRWSLVDLAEPNVAAAAAVESIGPTVLRLQFDPLVT